MTIENNKIHVGTEQDARKLMLKQSKYFIGFNLSDNNRSIIHRQMIQLQTQTTQKRRHCFKSIVLSREDDAALWGIKFQCFNDERRLAGRYQNFL